MVAKFHHALVDGRSAVEVAMLLFDVTPDARPAPAAPWRPEPEPGTARLALGALVSGAGEPLRAARGMDDTVRSAALSVGDDLLRPAPASYLNVPIGPRRTLLRHRTSLAGVREVARAADATVNDVCLAAVAGALRELALARGESPQVLKAMVPVSVLPKSERSDFGNRISMAFVDLPVSLSTPGSRLAEVTRATSAFKADGRPAGAEAVVGALGLLPDALRTGTARMVGSSWVYNLTVSNIPGPAFPLYVLGSRLREAYPVVPIAEEHALSIGIFGYLDHLHFGLYADPESLPDVRRLPASLNAALLALTRYGRRLLRSTNSDQPELARSAKA